MPDHVLEIARVQGLATIQDLGVRGFMDEALPPGGAMVPELLVAANRSVGNPDDACGIEVCGRASVRAVKSVVVAIDDGPLHALEPDEILDIASGTRRCAYLAVRGGVHGIPFRGRLRGTLLAANIGAPLAADAKLSVRKLGSEPNFSWAANLASIPTNPVTETSTGHWPFVEVTIIMGPDFEAFDFDALGTLTGAPYRILPASNRVGTRLSGAALPRRADYRQRSFPMTIGAIEVPADGQPIVFGPEHPVTGGHPLIGVVATADLGRFHAIPLGGSVRFKLA